MTSHLLFALVVALSIPQDPERAPAPPRDPVVVELESQREATGTARADAESADSKRAALERRIANVPQRLAELAAEALPEPIRLELDADSATLEAALAAREELQTAARARRDAARTAVSTLAARRAELPGRIATTRQRLEALPAVPTPPSDREDMTQAQLAELSQAARERLEAERAALLAEVRRMEVEQQSASGFERVAAAELKAAERALERYEAGVAELDRARAKQLRLDSQLAEAEALEQARKAMVLENERLASEAAVNVGLASERAALAERRVALTAREQDVEARLESLEAREQDTEERLDAVGLSDAVGLHLRQERLDLGDIGPARARLRELTEELARLSLRLIEIKGDIGRLPREEAWVASMLGDSGATDIEAARIIASDLFKARRDSLEALRDALVEVTRPLFQVEAQERQFVEKLGSYQDLIESRVLWVRSAPPIWSLAPSEVAGDVRRLVSLERFKAFLVDVNEVAAVRLPTFVTFVALLIALFTLRPAAARRLVLEGERAAQRSQVNLRPTVRACAWTALLVVPVAVTAIGLAWRFDEMAQNGAANVALARSITRAAVEVVAIGLLRRVLAKGGLAEAHFDWNPNLIKTLRRSALWLQIALPLATVLDALVSLQDGLAGRDVAGRAVFLVGLAVTTRFFWRAVRLQYGSSSRYARTRRSWFILVGGVGAVLAALTLLGYSFTTRALFVRLELTLAFAFLVLVVRELVLRALMLARRREALERLRRRREESRLKREREREARRKAGEEDEDEPEDEGLSIDESEPDYGDLTEDARQLVRVSSGLAMIGAAFAVWSDALPALAALNSVTLWSESGGGAVTLRNLLVALAVLLLGLLAARNLPSVLEIAVLRRFGLASGERYAIMTLVRYGITIVVFLLAFDQLGVAWAKAQWLVAGVSVGLGFGLQEIFANFVSGILLLFERPIRVGDWVTLGEIEGVVSKIRIRATIIRDRDLRELIVPNREFVTGRFINWTLTDSVTRVVVPVGIAYGSDTEAAARTLLECGRTSPFQVEEPVASVIFRSFGASSLDFELRVFVQGREVQPRVVHDLHMRIDAAFRAAKIEIAFPQRDLHLRSLGGLEKLITPREAMS